MTALLSVRGLSMTYAGPRPVHALRDLSFDLERGRSLALVGESGSGKTTAARCIAGLERPTAGTVALGGVELQALSHRRAAPHRRRMQMVFQDASLSLDPRMKVGAIVAEPLAIHRAGDRRTRRSHTTRLLESVGLSASHAERHPHELSGGQRQRVAIARALALEPEVLICDEPTSALDVSVQAQIVELLRDLQERLGLALLLIAHDLALVRTLCHDVCVLYLGRTVERSSRERLFAEPAHPYTRALLSAVPRTDPAAERARERIVLVGEIPSPADPPPGCAFHTRCPERSRIASDRCRREEPRLLPAGGGIDHLVACHLVR